MSELIYVKGQGWVYSNFDRSPTFSFRDGSKAYFEFRSPNPGEFYDGASPEYSNYFPNGRPDWDKWIANYVRKSSDSLHLHCIDAEHAKHLKEEDSFDMYVTLVLL